MAEDVPNLRTPRISVVLEDGTEHTFQSRNKDLVTWDRERAKRNWPDAQSAPFVWMNFLAWRCALREGVIPEGTALAAFEDSCLSVASEEGRSPDPTQSVAMPD